jgi:hypothetical protein
MRAVGREGIRARSALWLGFGLIIAIVHGPGSWAAARPENESGSLEDGRFSFGAGSSYQYDGTKTVSLALATWTWDDDRYELAAIKFLGAQIKHNALLAKPNWLFQVQRRWSLMHSRFGRLFFGGGAAYKTEIDAINGSRLNFAEELLWRLPWEPTGGQFEIAVRHVSNAGIKRPNKGQDFVTLVYAF